MLDLLIENALIVDGSGEKAFKGDIGILNGKLIINPENKENDLLIDAKGRIVTPGFIDAHSHGDLVLGKDFAKLCKTSQGITTEMAGQCGFSMAPINPKNLKLIQKMLMVGTQSFPDAMEEWSEYGRYMEWTKEQETTINIKMMVGHSTLRVAVMGFENRPSTDEELEKMKELLKDAMENGAAGLSTGLIYTPSCYAETKEIVELAKVLKPYGGFYASHMRNESGDSIKAIEEVLYIGRQADIPVFISHHKICGKENWGLEKKTLKLIEKAVSQGIQVTCDQYPYLCNQTHLNVCIPPEYFHEGVEALAQKLKDPKIRKEIKDKMMDPKPFYDNYYLNSGGWDGVFVASSPKTPEAEGKYISEYANQLNKDPFETYFDILVENKGDSSAIYSTMEEEGLFEIIKAENTIVGTDGLARFAGEKGHPRAYGSFPHALNYFVKEKGIMPLEKMINKMTGLSAERLGLKAKGLLKDGYDADVLIIDYDNLKDRASYRQPCGITKGIDYVIVNGEIVWENGDFTGINPGKVIKHNE